ncbi:MAG: hypothetical protein AB1420_15190 [Bacillota bacterium]
MRVLKILLIILTMTAFLTACGQKSVNKNGQDMPNTEDTSVTEETSITDETIITNWLTGLLSGERS